MLSQNTMGDNREVCSAVLCVGVHPWGCNYKGLCMSRGLKTRKIRAASACQPLGISSLSETLGMGPSAALWLGAGHVPNILSRQQLSPLTFIYSLPAGSSALSICDATQVSPSKPHSPVSSLLSYIPARAAPIKIPPLPSAGPPKPLTQPFFYLVRGTDFYPALLNHLQFC